jgi:hypothetical protein
MTKYLMSRTFLEFSQFSLKGFYWLLFFKGGWSINRPAFESENPQSNEVSEWDEEEQTPPAAESYPVNYSVDGNQQSTDD